MIKKNYVKPGAFVWVNTGKPAYDLDGGFVGQVIEVYSNGAVVVQNADQKQKFVNIHQLTEIVDFPIDEKNIVSDWIIPEFFDDGVCCGDEYAGFLFGNPIHCWVDNGKFHIKNISNGPAAYDFIHERIIDLFDCCSNNEIVTYRKFDKDNHLVVTFYSFIK